MSMNGSAETASATTPARMRGGDASAAVNSPPTTITGRIAASPSIPVERTCASTRAIPGAGSVRRYGSHGFSRFSAMVSPKLKSAFDMTANTASEITASVANTRVVGDRALRHDEEQQRERGEDERADERRSARGTSR